MSFRLTEQNRINLERASQLINASGTAILNYILEKTLSELEKNLAEMPEELKSAFKAAISSDKMRHVEAGKDSK